MANPDDSLGNVASSRDAVRRLNSRGRRARRGRSALPPRSQSALGRLFCGINALYREHRALRVNGNRIVGKKTQQERRIVIDRAMRDLHALGYELQNPKNLRGVHIRVIIQEWRRRGLKASTLSTNFSHLRTLCRWLRKPDLVHLIDQIVADNPMLTRRRTVADRDRSEATIGLSRERILELAAQRDERFACLLNLIMKLGLRAQEAFKFQPHHVVGPRGEITIKKGAKGGRRRVLPFPMTPEQAEAIEWCKKFAQTPGETMIPRDWTAQQLRGWFYRHCERVGLARKHLGITAHSFRHGVLQRVYRDLTGEEAPVRGGRLRNRDPIADDTARETVAQFAGHSRRYVSSHYLGGVRLPRDSAVGGESATTAESTDTEPPSPDETLRDGTGVNPAADDPT
jgi:integrase